LLHVEFVLRSRRKGADISDGEVDRCKAVRGDEDAGDGDEGGGKGGVDCRRELGEEFGARAGWWRVLAVVAGCAFQELARGTWDDLNNTIAVAIMAAVVLVIVVMMAMVRTMLSVLVMVIATRTNHSRLPSG